MKITTQCAAGCCFTSEILFVLLGDDRGCEEMQKLPVHTDQAGVQRQTVNRDRSQCERAGQGPAGE